MASENGSMSIDEARKLFPGATVVWAQPGEQVGLPYLAGNCPHCTQRLALSGPGFGTCHNCNHALEFRDEKDKPATGQSHPKPAAASTEE